MTLQKGNGAFKVEADEAIVGAEQYLSQELEEQEEEEGEEELQQEEEFVSSTR